MSQEEVVKAVIEMQISKEYFSYILNAQILIFSLIVASIVSLYFFFNEKINKKYIDTMVKRLRISIKEKLSKEIENDFKKSLEDSEKRVKLQERKILSLEASLARTLGFVTEKQGLLKPSFLWWLRAAEYCVKGEDDKTTRVYLKSAYRVAQKIKNREILDGECIGDYQKIVSSIDDVKYKIEKELIEIEVKRILSL